MTPDWIAAIGLIALGVMVLVRVPVAVAMALVGFLGYAAVDGFSGAVYILATSPMELASAYSLTVVPLFSLMGAFAATAGLSNDLFRATERLFKGTKGSMAMSAIGACAAFGAVCGSSVATAATMARVAIPVMLEAGYSRALAAGTVAAGGTLGVLIPPSTILLIYGLVAEQSIARLFAAAIIPGILLCLLYIAVVVVYVRLWPDAAPDTEAAAAVSKASGGIKEGGGVWHVGLLFAFVIGGIYLGWFSPTEAAAIGAFGALALGAFSRRITFAQVKTSLFETTLLSARLFFIILASTIFSYFVVQTRISVSILAGVDALGLSPTVLIYLVVLFYVVAGFVIEGIGMILITVPILYPVVTAAGFDPIWFGILLVVVVEIGLITPPVGINLFVIRSQVDGISTRMIYQGAALFLLAPLVLIVLLISYPQLALWLPSTLN